jgi:hypothetical protein
MPQPKLDRTNLLPFLLIVALLFFSFVRKIAGWVLEYEWWKELEQRQTLFSLILYGFLPVLLTGIVAFGFLWVAHARALNAAGTSLGEHKMYSRVSTLALLFFAYITASVTVDTWTAVLYFGGRQLPAEATVWRDPVFAAPLSFYMFELPFYRMFVRIALALAFLCGLLYFAASLGWRIRSRGVRVTSAGEIEWAEIDFTEGLASKVLKGAAIIFLLGLAAHRYFARYDLLTSDHQFMVGIDWVDDNIRLPLLWLETAGCLAAAGLAGIGRWIPMAAVAAVPLLVSAVIPRAIHALHVRPNEISIEKPYIERHIQATRAAFGLDRRSKEVEFGARIEARVDPAKHRPLFDNVRLWDWRAFHDTVTQIQALRPYYVFADTDVDRYNIDGQYRQVMLTPRELDVRQLSADARTRWMNPHFIYTHGYGVVLAEANRITTEGLPVLFIQNAPAEVKTNSLSLSRPEIYYGEVAHEPIFVRTGQPEFNYPSGAENVHTNYEGRGGFPIKSIPLRFAAALSYADWNILLTGFFTTESRMIIHRNIRERVEQLAGFLQWDADPYLVIKQDGRLVWMIDGYTTSMAHPYSRSMRLPRGGEANYVRNSVKATIDAYDGDVRLYIFDPSDPIIMAYARLFPELFRKVEEMPADLREHTRYPEGLFRVQAEMYRTFHMRDPEAFYNKEDSWDVARFINSQHGKPETLAPTYVVATLPGETKSEFLLMVPFTPRNKDNLIGFMAARCDGGKLGELLFLQLSKQELVFGPMQIEARINQDQNISKDLTLWNQQGSQVLRGQMLVLPVEDTFVYIEPIYIQASEARMPQLKKVVIAVGNTLIYADTYDQALAQLAGMRAPAAVQPSSATAPSSITSTAPGAPAAGEAERRLDQLRRHMQRYRELVAQGKWADAGKELEALEGALRR